MIRLLSLVFIGLCMATGSLCVADNPIAFFETHCVKCHNAKKQKGKMRLDDLAFKWEGLKTAERWKDILIALEDGEMPPEDEKTIDPKKRAAFIASIQKMLDEGSMVSKEFPLTPIKRMNRFQYNNAVTDLLDLKKELFALPERIVRDYNYFKPATGKMADVVKVGSRPLGKSQLIGGRFLGVTPFPQDLRAENGYDNRGDHLTLSPLLMEQFLKLSQSIVTSPDFNAKSSGIYRTFFLAPQGQKESDGLIQNRLAPFLRQAFRGPVAQSTLDRYVRYALAKIQSGKSFEESMKLVVSAILVSPRFLYVNKTSGGKEFELASRLSFFLWGSVPDFTLLNLAEEGTLGEPKVLAAQVERMLVDPKIKRFCDSFPTQWLQIERIIASKPDKKRYPTYYKSKFYVAGMHTMLEPLLVFETVLIENRSILQLIDSDFSYRSDWLKCFYDSPDVKVKFPVGAILFSRVPITDRRQGGVITTAAVMTMTSSASRTQPVTRGVWMASVIFNNPPEPAPADVPPLDDELDAASKDMTLRERFKAHREIAGCTGCHKGIDPLGFALENYDPIGHWRDKYDNGRHVDMNGKLFNQYEFSNIVEFKDVLLDQKDKFAKAFAGHLLAFALGREVTAADSPSLSRVVFNTSDENFRLKSILTQVVLSESFMAQSADRHTRTSSE